MKVTANVYENSVTHCNMTIGLICYVMIMVAFIYQGQVTERLKND